jgi:hypothetical protein
LIEPFLRSTDIPDTLKQFIKIIGSQGFALDENLEPGLPIFRLIHEERGVRSKGLYQFFLTMFTSNTVIWFFIFVISIRFDII